MVVFSFLCSPLQLLNRDISGLLKEFLFGKAAVPVKKFSPTSCKISVYLQLQL